MRRASFLRRFPLLVLAVALVALAVFYGHGSRPAAAQQGEVWSATLTVANLGGGNLGCFTVGGVACSLRLTDRTFTYDNTQYTVAVVLLQLDGALQVRLTSAWPSGLVQSDLALHVGDTQLLFSAATLDTHSATNDRLTWANTGLTWTVGQTISLRMAPPVTDVEVSLSASPNPVLEGQSVGVTARLGSPLPAGERRDLRIPVLIKWGSEYTGGQVVTYGTADQGDLYSLGSVLSQTTDSSGNARIAWWLPTTITIGSGAHQRIDGINNMETNQDGDSDDDTFTVELDTTHPDWPEGIVAGDAASVLVTITDDDRRDGPPAAPVDLRFSEGDARLDFTWKPGSRAGAPAPPTRYDVQWTLNPLRGEWTAVDRTGRGTEASQSITGLENGRLVWVRVRAANRAGASGWLEGTARPTEPADPSEGR